MQRGPIAALASAVLFGVSTPLAKMLVGTVPPLLLAGLLYAGSGVGLSLVLLGRRLRASSAPPSDLPRGSDWLWLAGAIVAGGVAGPIALTYGLAACAASTASLLLNLEAVFTALIAWILFRENFDRRVVVGMACIVAGGVLLAGAAGGGDASSGGVLIVLACLCWAIDNNLTRHIAAADAVTIAALKGIVAGGVNLGLARVAGQSLPATEVLGLAMAVGFLGYGVSLVLYVKALRDLGTARAGAYFSVAPFFGAALAVLLQRDAVTLPLVGAGLLMAAGVYLHLTERHGHLHEHERLEHSHDHVHDEHHRHDHGPGWDGREPHTHLHVHAPIVHRHRHFPDLHHRHPH